MKTTVCMTVVFGLYWALFVADNNGLWKEFTTDDRSFKVLFPVDPEVAETVICNNKAHRAAVKRESTATLGFFCTWFSLPRAFGSKAAEIEYLKGAQTGVVNTSKGELDSARDLDLAGMNGREFGVKVSEINFVRFQVYLNGRDVYYLQVWGRDKKAVYSEDAKKFLESFSVKKRGAETSASN